jgi:hypothetical protein
MAKDWISVIRYLISPEESRIGRKDYWNTVFLSDKTPINRMCLEISKVLVLITMSISIIKVLAEF